MAEALGVEFPVLHAAWRRLRPQRDAGELPGGEAGSWSGARIDDLGEVVALL